MGLLMPALDRVIKSLLNASNYTFNIFRYFFIGEMEGFDSGFGKLSVSFTIFLIFMGPAIDFNRQVFDWTKKIKNEWHNHVLTTKFKSGKLRSA